LHRRLRETFHANWPPRLSGRFFGSREGSVVAVSPARRRLPPWSWAHLARGSPLRRIWGCASGERSERFRGLAADGPRTISVVADEAIRRCQSTVLRNGADRTWERTEISGRAGSCAGLPLPNLNPGRSPRHRDARMLRRVWFLRVSPGFEGGFHRRYFVGGSSDCGCAYCRLPGRSIRTANPDLILPSNFGMFVRVLRLVRVSPYVARTHVLRSTRGRENRPRRRPITTVELGLLTSGPIVGVRADSGACRVSYAGGGNRGGLGTDGASGLCSGRDFDGDGYADFVTTVHVPSGRCRVANVPAVRVRSRAMELRLWILKAGISAMLD
jgi:hypothetical protein